MAGSVITIFRWKIFRISSAALILLWAFNPLGSQASFRGVQLRQEIGTSEGHITYYNPSIQVQEALTPFTHLRHRSKPTILALYSSTLYDYIASLQYVDLTDRRAKDVIDMLGGERTSAIQAAMDNWGNVRIPSLEYHPAYNLDDPYNWLETTWNEKMINFSSLVGDRVDGVDRAFTGNTTFQSSSSYQNFEVSALFPLAWTTESSLCYYSVHRGSNLM
jgi:hypothetical protein